MSRAFDFVVITVIYVVAIVVHLMGIELLGPGTPLHALATSGTGSMNGAERADLWYEIITVWAPLIAMFGISAYGIVREYRRQAATAVQRVR